MKKLIFFVLLIVASVATIYAQQITGVIVDNLTLEPIPGVNVMIKGTTTGGISDVNGVYTVEVSGPETVLVFSFVGYSSIEETVGNRTSIDITLTEDLVGLDEVVVIGYGTVKKTSLTAAVSTVDAEDLKSVTVSNSSNALVGRVPGLITVQNDGEVGSQTSGAQPGEVCIKIIRCPTLFQQPDWIVT